MFTIILNQIFKMFLLMIVGVMCYKTKIIDDEGNKTLSNLLLVIICPLLIIDAFQIDYNPELLKGFFIAFILSFLTNFILIVASKFIVQKKNNPNCNIECFSCVYSNCGFMGIPLISSILGGEGVLYLTTYIITFNIFAWTYGLMQITGNMSLEQFKKGLFSPVVYASIGGMILFVLNIKLPSVIGETIKYISDMNTPMAMIVAGITLAQSDIIKAVKNVRIYFVSAVKLLLMPAFVLLIFCFLPFNADILCTILIASACPSAALGTLFALKYAGNYKYASEIFAFTTIMSMFSIPLIVYLAEIFIY